MGLTEADQFQYDQPVPSEEYEQIIQELARWCTPRGRKQDLARRLKVSHSLVSLWLSGEREIGLERWIEIKTIIRTKPRKRVK
jgi:transcriptional regulator with XRE-family HTH domain